MFVTDMLSQTQQAKTQTGFPDRKVNLPLESVEIISSAKQADNKRTAIL
jgi:hypothetical protein